MNGTSEAEPSTCWGSEARPRSYSGCILSLIVAGGRKHMPIATRRRGPLDAIEWVGNKLPDPAILFLILMVVVWLLSALLLLLCGRCDTRRYA